MTGPILNIKVTMDGADAADSKLKKIEGQSKSTEKATDGLTSSFGKLAAGMVAFAATAFTLDKAITTIAGFEKSMSAVQAITRANTEELAALRDVAKQLGASTEYSASQAADALKFLGMAGFQASQAIAAIPDVLDLATASAMGLAQAADISSNIMSGFGLQANQAGDVADILAAAASRANTDVTQLGDAMKYAAPVAHSLGISMGDTAAAAIGVMSDAGIQGSQAGTGLRAVLASLVKPSKEGETALKAMGLTMKDVNPQTKSLAEIFKLLQERGLNAQAAMMLFGREAASSGLAMAASSAKLGDLSNQLRDVSGEAKRMADTMRDNLSGDLDNLSSAAEGLILAIGEAGLTSALRSTFQAATALVGVFTEMAQYLPEAAYVVGALATAFGVNLVMSLGATAIASFNAATAVTGMTTAAGLSTLAVNALSGSVRLLNLAFTTLGGPVGIAVGILAGALYLSNQRANEAKEAADRYAEAIRLAGERSHGASGGIEKASAELFKLGNAASETERKLRSLDALRMYQNAVENLGASIRQLGTTAGGWSTVKMQGDLQALAKKFEGGEISAEEMLAAIDQIDNADPDVTKILGKVQQVIRVIAAARGEMAALAAGVQPLADAEFNARWEGAPSDKPSMPPTLNLPSSGGGSGKGKGGGTSEAEKIADEMKSRLEALKSGLQSEMEAKIEAYAKDMETLKWYLDNKKMTEEEYEFFKDGLQEKAFERGLTEEERLAAEYERQLQMLQQFLEAKKISEEEYLAWKAEVTAQHEEQMSQLRGMQYADALSSTGDLMGAMASAIGNGNDKMLRAQKIFGAASALVSTYIGAAKALELGFPQNLAAMAAVLAKGMSLVAAIKSGSKSSGSGGGGGGTTQATTPQQSAPIKQAARIDIHGEVFGREQMIKFIEGVNELVKDGYEVYVRP